jgi:hypothetical protein
MVVALIATALLVRRMQRVASETESLALLADARHYSSDILVTAGAIVGLGLYRVTGLTILDPLISIVLVLPILRSAWHVLRSATDDLMDRELPDAERSQLIELINGMGPPVLGYHGLRAFEEACTYAREAGDQLVRLEGPDGVELFDVPDGPHRLEVTGVSGGYWNVHTCTSGWATIALNSLLRRATISFGRLGGPYTPAHWRTVTCGTPASSMVGTSGSSGERFFSSTASGRSLPSFASEMAFRVLRKLECTRPVRRSGADASTTDAARFGGASLPLTPRPEGKSGRRSRFPTSPVRRRRTAAPKEKTYQGA